MGRCRIYDFFSWMRQIPVIAGPGDKSNKDLEGIPES